MERTKIVSGITSQHARLVISPVYVSKYLITVSNEEHIVMWNQENPWWYGRADTHTFHLPQMLMGIVVLVVQVQDCAQIERVMNECRIVCLFVYLGGG
jgi:hypothetical protein